MAHRGAMLVSDSVCSLHVRDLRSSLYAFGFAFSATLEELSAPLEFHSGCIGMLFRHEISRQKNHAVDSTWQYIFTAISPYTKYDAYIIYISSVNRSSNANHHIRSSPPSHRNASFRIVQDSRINSERNGRSIQVSNISKQTTA